MNSAARIILVVTLFLIAAIGFMPPRQALDYDNKFVLEDGSLAPRPIAVARNGIFSDAIYRYNYHKGGGAYTDIPATVDTGRLIAEFMFVVGIGGSLIALATLTARRLVPA